MKSRIYSRESQSREKPMISHKKRGSGKKKKSRVLSRHEEKKLMATRPRAEGKGVRAERERVREKRKREGRRQREKR